MNTELPPTPVPTVEDTTYARLLMEGLVKLMEARLYREGTGKGWRPLFADAWMLDTMRTQSDDFDSWWAQGDPTEAFALIVASGRSIELVPGEMYEFIDEDIQNALSAVGLLARESDEVCGGCGKRYPEGTGEVIDCENDGCPGTCPDCQDKPCPYAEGVPHA